MHVLLHPKKYQFNNTFYAILAKKKQQIVFSNDSYAHVK